MVNKDIIIIADYSSSDRITLEELCQICSITQDVVHVYVHHDIVQPHGEVAEQWQFTVDELQRVKMALRLQHDFEVNIEGLSLVLHLLDELNDLRAQIKLMNNNSR